MKVCIIDYGMGNIKSVSNAIENLGKEADLISDPKLIDNYDIIILPGVGAFKRAMEVLTEKKLDIAIKKAVSNGKRIIGFCLGMQLLFSSSKEFGYSKGLNLIYGEVLPFDKKINLRIPHMGWNNISIKKKHPILNNLDNDSRFYFLHSYYCDIKDNNYQLASTDYEFEFTSIFNYENIYGIQCHPEKSHQSGITFLKNFALT